MPAAKGWKASLMRPFVSNGNSASTSTQHSLPKEDLEPALIAVVQEALRGAPLEKLNTCRMLCRCLYPYVS
jgi:nitrogen fixation protein